MAEPLHVVCPSFDAVNRALPARRAEATCGRCKVALFPGASVALSAANFERHAG